MAYDKQWDDTNWVPEKEDVVDLLFEVVNGYCSCRKAATLIVSKIPQVDEPTED